MGIGITADGIRDFIVRRLGVVSGIEIKQVPPNEWDTLNNFLYVPGIGMLTVKNFRGCHQEICIAILHLVDKMSIDNLLESMYLDQCPTDTLLRLYRGSALYSSAACKWVEVYDRTFTDDEIEKLAKRKDYTIHDWKEN